MGKKQVDAMEEMGGKFIEGAESWGVDKKTAKEVYDLMAKFAGYGFNKAHAAVYAHLSYQTAYVKVHYPLEYMTAYLAAYLGDMDEFLKMRNEAERVGIRMLPPDVNRSDYEFSIEDGNIRIGLAAVKNVGKAAESILSAREEKGKFASIFDVCKSTDNRIVNKKALESLICAGAFDGLGGSRAQHIEAVAMAIEYGNSSQKERASGQVNLFDAMQDASSAVSAPEPKLPNIAPWPLNINLQKEKDILGFYASGHPLDQYYDEIKAFSDVEITPESLSTLKDGAPIMIGGVVATVKPKTDKHGKPMAFVTLESFESSMEMIVFAGAYGGCKELLVPDNMILAYGSIMNRDEAKPKLRVESCIHLSLTRAMYAKSVHIKISIGTADKPAIEDIYKCCGEYPGDCYLIIHITTPDNNRHKIRAGNISMAPSADAINKLRGILGRDNVWIGKGIA
jgi:DNA polymerase-3 subunit alpha